MYSQFLRCLRLCMWEPPDIAPLIDSEPTERGKRSRVGRHRFWLLVSRAGRFLRESALVSSPAACMHGPQRTCPALPHGTGSADQRDPACCRAGGTSGASPTVLHGARIRAVRRVPTGPPARDHNPVGTPHTPRRNRMTRSDVWCVKHQSRAGGKLPAMTDQRRRRLLRSSSHRTTEAKR